MPKQYYKINIEITNICNLQCSFCPEVIRTKRMMSLELFRAVLQQVAPLTKQVALHLMGDPLLHPQLADFVDACHKFKLRIFFVTNGVLLDTKTSELLLHPAFRQINFSLHSFADNFGEKDPQSYLEKIFAFTESAFERHPRLFINYRLWNLSDHRGKNPQNILILSKIADRFGLFGLEHLDTRLKKNVPVKNRLSLHFDTEFTWPGADLPVIGTTGTCHGLSSHFGILVDGTVVPCCLDKEGNIPLGKIPETPLSDILNSPRAKAMLSGFRGFNLVESLCQRCQYIERFQKPSPPVVALLRLPSNLGNIPQNGF